MINYVEKSYESIFEKMLHDSFTNKLISHASEFESYIKNREDISNFLVMMESIHAESLHEVYKSISLVYDSINLDKCSGVDLDNIGNICGVSRVQATSASVEIQLTLPFSQNEDILLEKGIQCITQKGISYHTVEDAYFIAGETEKTVLAIADKKGTSSKISEGELYKIATKLNVDFTVSCTNLSGSSGGTDIQNDNEYRVYLKKWIEIHQKGNEWAYKYCLANFNGLDGYKLIPKWNGTGTMKIIIDPGQDYLRNEVYHSVQKEASLFDDDLYVAGYEPYIINIYAKVNVDIDQINPYSSTDKDEIKSRIIKALKVYIDGGYKKDGSYHNGLTIGEDFIPHKAGVFLDNEITELKNIKFLEPEDYVKLNDEEKAVAGNINIEMI